MLSYKKTLLLFVSVWAPLILGANTPSWYIYSLQYKQMGYAKVNYRWEGEAKVWAKEKEKVQWVGETRSSETISAILDRNYLLRSAHITDHEGNFTIVSVTDRTIIQSKGKTKVLKTTKFHLDIDDCLRYLFFHRNKLKKTFQGRILATSYQEFSRIYVEYKGLQKSSMFPGTHLFRFQTSEFRNFWANAWLDSKGQIVAYQLGKFWLLKSEKEKAKKIDQLPSVEVEYFLPSDAREVMLFLPQAEKYFTTTQRQEVFPNQIRLYLQPKWIAKKTIAAPTIPTQNSLLIRLAHKARGRAKNLKEVVSNIGLWVQKNLVTDITPEGERIYIHFQMDRNTPNKAFAAFCNVNGVPCKILPGLRYRDGVFHWESICEVYVNGRWGYAAEGKVDTTIVFLTANKNWQDIPSFSENIAKLTVQSLRMKQKTLTTSNPSTYFYEMNGTWVDELLKLRFTLPKNWQVAPRNPKAANVKLFSDQGNIILLQVFRVHKSFEEILENLKSKIGNESYLEILWQNPRTLSGGKGIEVALKSKNSSMVYRAYLGNKGTKGILVLLVTPEKTLSSEERSLQALLSSFIY